MVEQTTKNSNSVISLIMGILSILIPIIGLVFGLIGIVASRKAVNEIEKTNQVGHGLATSGLICSSVGIVIQLFILIGLITFNNYSDYNSAYNNDDLAAVVRGEEITVGELRFLFSDDKILDYLDGLITAKLAIQETKRLNIDVSEQVEMIDSQRNSSLKSAVMDEFVVSQAKKLGMNPEEYYEKHLEITTEMSAYVVAYVRAILGEPVIDELADPEELRKQLSAYDEQANKLLNNLVEENRDEIEIFIR